MENIVLTIHILLAISLIGLVLMQRSEGGGLGMGGGGGGGMMSSRGVSNALTKATWIIALAFIMTSIALTAISAKNSKGDSVLDSIGISEPALDAILPPTVDPALPTATETAPASPPKAE